MFEYSAKFIRLLVSGFSSIWGKFLYAASAVATILTLLTFFSVSEVPTPKLAAGVTLYEYLENESILEIANASMDQFGKPFNELNESEIREFVLPPRLLSFVFYAENPSNVPIESMGASMSVFLRDVEIYHDYYEVRFTLQPGEEREGGVQVPPEIEDFDRVSFCAEYSAKYPWLYHRYEVSYELQNRLAFLSNRLLNEVTQTKLWFQPSGCNFSSSHNK